MTDPTRYTEDEWEVSGGKMLHRRENGEKVLLTKGDRFHPRQAQVESGSLENKAHPVRRASPRTVRTVTEDIGIRSLPWAWKPALKKALQAEPVLTVEELIAVGGETGSGATGFVTSDVDAALEARGG